jgi:hypothetical protein
MSQYSPPGPPQAPPPQFQSPYSQQPTPKPKPKVPGWLKASGIGFGTFILGIIIGSTSGGSAPTAGTGTPESTVTITQPTQAAPTATITQPAKPGPTVTTTVQVPGAKVTVTAKPPGPAVGIAEDGTWLVGVDVKAGTYRSSNSGDCYWARLKNTNGDLDSILANGNGGNQVVTIKRTDKAFESANGCAPWTKVG